MLELEKSGEVFVARLAKSSMAGNFENQENSDTDSSWGELTDEVWNSSIEGGDKVTFYKSFFEPSNSVETSNLMDLRREMKILSSSSSSDEFEVIDNIESLLCSADDSSSDDFSPTSSLLKELKDEEEVRNCSEEIKTPSVSSEEIEVFDDVQLVPSFQAKENLELDFDNGIENTFNSEMDKLDDNGTNKSLNFSIMTRFNPDTFYHGHTNVLGKTRPRRNQDKKFSIYPYIGYCFVYLLGITFTVTMYECELFKHSPMKTTSTPAEAPPTPVKTSNPIWEFLTQEFEYAIKLSDSFDVEDREQYNVEKDIKNFQGISFGWDENGMVINIGVNEEKTYVIYKKDGVIDVKMLREKLTIDTALFFTLKEKEKVKKSPKECPFIKTIRYADQFLNTLIMCLLLIMKIVLTIIISAFDCLLNIDDYTKNVNRMIANFL